MHFASLLEGQSHIVKEKQERCRHHLQYHAQIHRHVQLCTNRKEKIKEIDKGKRNEEADEMRDMRKEKVDTIEAMKKRKQTERTRSRCRSKGEGITEIHRQSAKKKDIGSIAMVVDVPVEGGAENALFTSPSIDSTSRAQERDLRITS